VTKRSKEVFAGTESELISMSEDLDQLHHDVGVPAMRDGVAAMIEDVERTPRSTSRRTFLLGAGAAAAAGGAMLALGAAPALAGSSSRRFDAVRPTEAAAFPPSGLKGDLAVAAVAASLENLAVFAYNAGLTAAMAGKLGSVPPAVATFATTVKSQHQQHADAWNGVLKSHGKAAVTVTNPKLTPTVQSDFAKVADVAGLAQLALTLETIAAQTYQAETAMLKSKSAIGLSSSIQPVEMQHIAILYYVLGMYPGAQTASGTPLAFNPTSMAV
jgi:Ferritin-like domain